MLELKIMKITFLYKNYDGTRLIIRFSNKGKDVF